MTISIGEALAVGTGLFFAIGNLCSRAGIARGSRSAGLLTSFWVTTGILGVAAAVAFVVTDVSAPTVKGIVAFTFAGVGGTLVGRWAALESVHRLGPSRSVVYISAQPLLTTAVAALLLGEVLGTTDVVGSVVLLTGLLIALAERRGHATDEFAWGVLHGQRALGVTYGLVAALCYALGNVARKVGVDSWREPVIGASVGIAVALIGTHVRIRAPPWRPTIWRNEGWPYFAALGAATGAAQLMFFLSLLTTPVWKANVLASVEPVLTMILSAVFARRREPLGVVTFLSGASVLVGCWLLIAT